jgi:hypothetical protein
MISFFKKFFKEKKEDEIVPELPVVAADPPRCPVRWHTVNVKRDYQKLLADGYCTIFINSGDIGYQKLEEITRWTINEIGEQNFVVDGNWWWFTTKEHAIKFALRWYEKKKKL